MAISYNQENLGLLDIWRDYMREDLFHFNQASGKGAPLNEPCNVYIQPEREALTRALLRAKRMLFSELGYEPFPIWKSDTFLLSQGIPIERQLLRLREGYVQSFGQRAQTLIDDDVAIVYSDDDGDGVNDTATMTVTTTVAAGEIKVFFRTADGAPAAGDYRWEIEPLTVTKSGNTATIVGHRALFVKPSSFWDVPYDWSDDINRKEKNSADTSLAADFITLVDVYRVYNDTTTPAVVSSDDWLSEGDNTITFDDTTAAVQLVQSDISTFRVRWTCTACEGWPERVTVYYKAGYPLSYGRPDAELSEMLARLANTLHPLALPCEVCESSRRMWETDTTPVPADELSQREVGNPFGLLRGAVEAWRVVVARALARAGKVTRGSQVEYLP